MVKERLLIRHLARLGLLFAPLVLTLFVTGDVLAETLLDVGIDAPAVVRGAERSKPVSPEVFQGNLRNLPVAKAWRAGDPIREAPKGAASRSASQSKNQQAESSQSITLDLVPDETVDVSMDVPPIVAETTVQLNFDRIGFRVVRPPDMVGDVGPSNYIQMTNDVGGSVLNVYDKSGSLLVVDQLTYQTWPPVADALPIR